MSETTLNTVALRRANVWSSQLKSVLQDELSAQQWVNWLNEFPDGDTFNIPSVGEATARNYSENTPVVYDALDTGNFTFSITEYLQAGTYITKKAMQDAYYMAQLTSGFVPKQARAIAEKVETDILALGGAQSASGGPKQQASNLNSINGAAHRFVGSGPSESMGVADFARALHSLKKANVPDTNLIAIVDPSVEYILNTLPNLTSISNNPRWEGIITSGLASGRRFVKNIYGFDVYTSNYLAKNTASETINSVTSATGVNNLFFSASSDILPFVGAWRQMPQVDGEYNKDLQREEYVTTCRYGVKLFRPENLVVVVTDTDVIA
jgi:hypothetical protein